MATSKWNIEIGTPVGKIPATLDFEENGTELTGTVTDQNGVTPIIEGKFENGTYSFKATLQGPGGKPATTPFTLTPDGDTLSGKAKLSIMTLRVTGTRA